MIDTQVVYDDSSDEPTTNQSSSNEDNQLDDLTIKIENDFYLNQWNTLGFGLQVTQLTLLPYLLLVFPNLMFKSFSPLACCELLKDLLPF